MACSGTLFYCKKNFLACSTINTVHGIKSSLCFWVNILTSWIDFIFLSEFLLWCRCWSCVVTPCGLEGRYRICACISHTFGPEFTLQNWGAAYTRNIMSFYDWARDAGIVCCETPSRDRWCLRLLSSKLLHTRECANVLPVYRHILITWD
jgi:hypothetical protein